jgi:sugar lactone lactonase YvrE
MKKIIIAIVILFNNAVQAQHSLQKLWVTDTITKEPESALYDREDNLLYVSMMDGSSSERDGIGGIAKIGTDGKVIDLNWITGLNAPKGIVRFGNRLFVADLTEIVVIDIANSQVLQKITVDSSKILNDITVDEKGVVFVSDPRAGKIYKLENGIVSVYLKDLTKPNGLKAIGNYLYVLANGSLVKFDILKNKTLVATGMDENTDGLERVKKGKYLVSCYTGAIYFVTEHGKIELLWDTRKEEKYSADLGYDAKRKIVYVPTLFNKTVFACKLK